MKTVVLVHGWGGSSQSDWLPWAKEALEKIGVKTIVPDMPDSETPEIEKWVTHLASVAGTPDKDTYFVGHSIGCQTILRYLETLRAPVGGAVFVAGWFSLKGLDESEKEIAKPWIETSIDFNKIKTILPRSIAIFSDDDPVVSYEENKKLFEERLGSEIVTVTGAGHIDHAGPLPELVEAFQKLSASL